jgi:hypothetical protein
MNLFFYMPPSGGRKDELLRAVAPYASEGRLEVFSSLKGFAARIRAPKDTLSIALIWNPRREDLDEIASMRDLLRGVRILLVLSDQERETIKLAHQVFPTYIGYVDDDVDKIISVLKRLARARQTGSRMKAGCP